MIDYGMPSQGGGLVQWDEIQKWYIFVADAPGLFTNGDLMPKEWSIDPAPVAFEPMSKEQIENLRKVLIVTIGPFAMIMPDNEITTYRDRLQKKADAMERDQEKRLAERIANRPEFKKVVARERDLSDVTSAVLARLS